MGTASRRYGCKTSGERYGCATAEHPLPDTRTSRRWHIGGSDGKSEKKTLAAERRNLQRLSLSGARELLEFRSEIAKRAPTSQIGALSKCAEYESRG